MTITGSNRHGAKNPKPAFVLMVVTSKEYFTGLHLFRTFESSSEVSWFGSISIGETPKMR